MHDWEGQEPKKESLARDRCASPSTCLLTEPGMVLVLVLVVS